MDVAPSRPQRVVACTGHAESHRVAVALTRVDAAFAGRTFAAYGGIYIVSALVWLAVVERTAPRATDIVGSVVCLAGAAIILYGGRYTAA